jgi:hypothetical protein
MFREQLGLLAIPVALRIPSEGAVTRTEWRRAQIWKSRFGAQAVVTARHVRNAYMFARSAGSACLPRGAGHIGKDDARKVVLTFDGRNVDLNIVGADGFVRLLHGETKTN